MLIPVFSLLALQLSDATPRLIGLALGGYGLTQGLLQIPLGLLSDRWGRKPILAFGLIIFIIGSLLGAMSHSITMMIIARILQGMGAIGGVLIALLTDLTSEKERTKAMAVIGMTIGLSFGVAMAISPLIASNYGLNGIFYFSALMGFAGLLLLYLMVPNSAVLSNPLTKAHYSNEASETPAFESTMLTGGEKETGPNLNRSTYLLKKAFTNKQLQCLNAGIFFQHLILTATFFAIPLLLKNYITQGYLIDASRFYIILMLISFLLMFPCIILAERKNQMKRVFHGAVFFTLVSQFLLVFLYQHRIGFCLLMLCYFLAFNVLEASLPSLVSKQASPQSKGTAMGIYSSSQFLGIFIGGLLSGLFYSWGGVSAIFVLNTFLSVIWLVINNNTRIRFSVSDSVLEIPKKNIDFT